MITRCRYCNSTSYGTGCGMSPHGIHEHVGNETKCEFCGKTEYGTGCHPKNPYKKHRHGHAKSGNKCRWCGLNATGFGCMHSPNRAHEH